MSARWKGLPPHDNRGRKITPELCTIYHRRDKLVEARFTTRLVYNHPDEMPSYARPRFSHGTWFGDIEVSEFAATERGALEFLQETLHTLGFEEQLHLTHTIAALRALEPAPSGVAT